MYTTTRGSPSPIRQLDNSSFNQFNSPEIKNVKHINSTIMDYINPNRQMNKMQFYDENSSSVRNTFLSNKIYKNYDSNNINNINLTYQRKIKVNRNQFEENKSSIFLPNDGAFTRLIGEVSSSYVQKVKENPNK